MRYLTLRVVSPPRPSGGTHYLSLCTGLTSSFVSFICFVLRPDFLEDGWREGDYLAATSAPLQDMLNLPPQVDAWGKYDDPLKTPETYCSRFQQRPSS
jgi:hypothetical protein